MAASVPMGVLETGGTVTIWLSLPSNAASRSTVRSAGLWVARVNEAHHLATVVFPRAVALNAAAKQVQSAQILRGRPAAGGETGA